MATRSIVTSQPDVECAVCERRLLRGEQPDLFLDAGQPRLVCELCAPRASHQGWKRGSAELTASATPLRARRARGIFERFRPTRRARRPVDSRPPRPAFTKPGRTIHPTPMTSSPSRRSPVTAPAPAKQRTRPCRQQAALDPSTASLHEAVAVFNVGEYPRRIASLTRSLGAPEVSVRAGEAVASSIVIVIAWELCWYTYEVDLDDMQGTQARAIAQGTELSELGPQDRLGNAQADERGALALL